MVDNSKNANSGIKKANLVDNLTTANSGVEGANLVTNVENENFGIKKANLVDNLKKANSGVEETSLVKNLETANLEVGKDILVGRSLERNHIQDDVSTLGPGSIVGTAHSSTSHPRWIKLFTEASSFHVPLRGDDLEYLIEGLHKSFPNLRRVQDLEEYTSYKRIMVSGTGNQKLILLLCIIYLSYATPTSMTLEDRSSTLYLFNFTHTSLRDNFSRVCAERKISPRQMVKNLQDKWLRIRANSTRRATSVVPLNSTTPTHHPSMVEKTITLRSSKMDELTSGSSWQTIKVAIIEALKSSPILEPVGRFFEANESQHALDYCADPTRVSAYANHAGNTYILSKLTKHSPLINQTKLSAHKSIGELILHLEEVINSKSDQLMSVTHELQKFLSVKYNHGHKQRALAVFMETYTHAWNALYNEAHHLTYDPPYDIPLQIEFAPILANLSIMNIEDISTSHHAQIVAAGTNSALAKSACVALRDKLSQIARTRNLQDDTRDVGGNVCRRTKEDEVFTLASFKEGWKNRARACAGHNTYPRGWSKLSNADKLTFKRYFEQCGGKFPDSKTVESKPETAETSSTRKRRVRVPAKDLEAFRAFQKARKSQHDSPVLE